MSKWKNRIFNHQFCQSLETFSKALEQFEFPSDLSEEAISDYARIKKVVNYLQVLIIASDPDLISINSLNEAAEKITSALNQFNQFVGNKNVGHLTNANNNLDTVLFSVSKIFFFGKLTNSDIKYIHGSYSKVLDQHLKSYKTKIEKDRGDLNSNFKELETNLLSSEEKITEFENKLKNLTTQADAKLTDFETRFTNELGAREIRFENMTSKLDEKMDKEFSNLLDKSTKTINALDLLKRDAEEVFGVIQNTVQAGAHKLYADEEKISANRYRGLALFLMMIAVSVIVVPEIYTIFKSVNLENFFDVEKLLKRIPISLILFVPAFYLARESNKHRQNEFNNRRQEMVLRTIDPYLSLLGNEKREEIKGIVAKNIFCNSQGNKKAEEDAVGILDGVHKIIKIVKDGKSVR